MTFTLETLKAVNESYDHQHRVSQSDVEAANRTALAIASSRSDAAPQVGDVVQYTTKHGDYHPKAHIEMVEDGKLSVCEHPSQPFVNLADGVLSTDTGGGAWSWIPANLERVGTTTKSFLTWGHCGRCANGAITVPVQVNVWRYVEGAPEFTTECYDKFHVTPLGHPDQYGYRYIVHRGAATPHTAFRTDEDYRSWLSAYRGVERDGAWPNDKIVWTYKQSAVCVAATAFETIQATESETLHHGRMHRCKRMYEGTTVITYICE